MFATGASTRPRSVGRCANRSQHFGTQKSKTNNSRAGQRRGQTAAQRLIEQYYSFSKAFRLVHYVSIKIHQSTTLESYCTFGKYIMIWMVSQERESSTHGKHHRVVWLGLSLGVRPASPPWSSKERVFARPQRDVVSSMLFKFKWSIAAGLDTHASKKMPRGLYSVNGTPSFPCVPKSDPAGRSYAIMMSSRLECMHDGTTIRSIVRSLVRLQRQAQLRYGSKNQIY